MIKILQNLASPDVVYQWYNCTEQQLTMLLFNCLCSVYSCNYVDCVIIRYTVDLSETAALA